MADMPSRTLFKSLYVQVLLGIAAGVLLGFVAPERGAAMRPLGDGFIKLVKMLIAPIVFSTVVVGIAHMGAMKEVGRIGLRALLYFETMSTLALVIDAPPPPETPTTPTTGLAITMGCKAATHGTPSPCNLAATYNGTPVPSTSFTSVDWDWGDGTAQMVAGPVGSRTYVQAGTYLVVPRATVTTVDGPKVATTSQSITVP